MTWEERFIWLAPFYRSWSRRGARERNQGRNLESRTESETMKECGLLALFHDLLGHLSYISPPAWGLPRAGPFHISPLSIPCLLDFPAEQSQKGTSLTAVLFPIISQLCQVNKTDWSRGWLERAAERRAEHTNAQHIHVWIWNNAVILSTVNRYTDKNLLVISTLSGLRTSVMVGTATLACSRSKKPCLLI